MKPTMLFAIVMITAIVIVAGFGLQIGDTTMVQLAPEYTGRILYVCPAADGTWDMMAQSLRPINRYVVMGLFGAGLVLLSVWGWQLYISMLKDKFDRGSFTKVWQLTKFWFWVSVIMLLLATTPNHYRRVTVTGATGNWVLCEANSPGVKVAPMDAVHSH